MNPEYVEIDNKMKASVTSLTRNFASVRTGRANASVLEKIHIDYYGVPTQVTQIATISSPEPRMLVIQPYDMTVLKKIEKEIQASDIGINPQNDGKVLRLVFPPLTEERRKEIVKGLGVTAEETKIAIRSIRRDALEKFKAQKKKSEITEDDLRNAEKDIQDLTDKYIREVDDCTKKKEAEILSI